MEAGPVESHSPVVSKVDVVLMLYYMNLNKKLPKHLFVIW